MSELVREHALTCPFCWESNIVVLDLSAGDQSYIEDCQVCCHPIQITLRAEAGELLSLETAPT